MQSETSAGSAQTGPTRICNAAAKRPRVVYRAALLCAGLLQAAAAQAQVAVVMSKETPIYREAAGALTSSLLPRKAAIHVFAAQSQDGVDDLVKAVSLEKPKVIAALGLKAAVEAAKAFPRIPLVYLMVVYPERVSILKREQIYGVSWLPAAGLMAQTFRTILPGARRVGMLSSLPPNAQSVQSAELKKLGIELVVASIQDASGIPQALRSLHLKVDALWMGVDPAFGNEASYEILKRWTQQNKIPLLAPFDLPKGGGVLAGIFASPAAAAGRAHQLVLALLDGREPGEALASPDTVQLTLDLEAADALGLQIPSAALKTATKVYTR